MMFLKYDSGLYVGSAGLVLGFGVVDGFGRLGEIGGVLLKFIVGIRFWHLHLHLGARLRTTLQYNTSMIESELIFKNWIKIQKFDVENVNLFESKVETN